MRQSLRINQYIFQSTLSVRRATLDLAFASAGVDISIHALREESDHRAAGGSDGGCISIHALREESDKLVACTSSRIGNFNPRSP